MSRVRLLLRHGADVTLANCKSELPLHKACSSIHTLEVSPPLGGGPLMNGLIVVNFFLA